jgi:hypothetical protein
LQVLAGEGDAEPGPGVSARLLDVESGLVALLREAPKLKEGPDWWVDSLSYAKQGAAARQTPYHGWWLCDAAVHIQAKHTKQFVQSKDRKACSNEGTVQLHRTTANIGDTAAILSIRTSSSAALNTQQTAM